MPPPLGRSLVRTTRLWVWVAAAGAVLFLVMGALLVTGRSPARACWTWAPRRTPS
ncbi:hypothetical protein H9657_09965 [Cellulomonas sp. Sa3CUA2]|uniref:Uncharacterized protein n=1 Tax=Cellulomonas avistercoris TaxID=2762242 RepID=A0ABR8QDV3_9CELL|nr:hypothetical protein [Cellulomonas avistercoris]MBD7918598.1 hypothetical protein [Cellulomonas avistercoris]